MYEHLAKLAEKIGYEIHSECTDPQEDCSDTTGEKIAEAIRAQDLQWTTEPPKQRGLYRAIDTKGIGWWVHVSQEPYREDVFYVSRFGYGHNVSLDNFTHWLGPLPMPEPPKERGL